MGKRSDFTPMRARIRFVPAPFKHKWLGLVVLQEIGQQVLPRKPRTRPDVEDELPCCT